MTDNKSDASASMRGDIYQFKYALFLMLTILKEHGPKKNIAVKVEGLDDIELSEDGKIYKLVQTKHITGKPLTDSTEHFWKTLKNWSCLIIMDKISVNNVIFSLVVTQGAGSNTILGLLSQKKIDEALEKIDKFILARRKKITNFDKQTQDLCLSLKANKDDKLSGNEKAFIVFENLGDQKRKLLESMEVNLSEPNLEQLNAKIKKLLPQVRQNHVDSFFNDLTEWWYTKVTNTFPIITVSEIEEKIQDLRDKYPKDSLPLHYEGKEISLPNDIDSRRFVRQLKAIGYNRQIEAAKQDYYKAYSERCEWQTNGYILPEDIIDYENILIMDGWKRKYDEVCDKFEADNDEHVDALGEKKLQSLGRKIYEETLKEFIPFKTATSITARYIMNGSYHELADKSPEPRVYWHPKFLELLKKKD